MFEVCEQSRNLRRSNASEVEISKQIKVTTCDPDRLSVKLAAKWIVNSLFRNKKSRWA